MDDKYNRWIRKLSPFSLSLNSAYLTIAEYLIQKLLDVRKNYQNDIPYFPKVKRVIWLVRHGERLDNDKELKERAKMVGYINDEVFT
uniref:Uncharacterized protein n=1 Tax=Meloidogyne javanica TaxID=6303 RepID=A0A915LVE5_MELJA